MTSEKSKATSADRQNAQGPHEGSAHKPEEFIKNHGEKAVDQRAQRHDPTNRHTADANERTDRQTKQPARETDKT